MDAPLISLVSSTKFTFKTCFIHTSSSKICHIGPCGPWSEVTARSHWGTFAADVDLSEGWTANVRQGKPWKLAQSLVVSNHRYHQDSSISKCDCLSENNCWCLERPPGKKHHVQVMPRLQGQSNGSSPTLAIQSAVPEEASNQRQFPASISVKNRFVECSSAKKKRLTFPRDVQDHLFLPAFHNLDIFGTVPVPVPTQQQSSASCALICTDPLIRSLAIIIFKAYLTNFQMSTFPRKAKRPKKKKKKNEITRST